MYQTRLFRWLLTLAILIGLYGGSYLQGQQPPTLIYGVDTATGIPHPVKVGSDGALGISASFSGAVVGAKTNNGAAPSTDNIGVLSVLANAAAPTWTEGRLVTLSTDLAGALRVSGGGGGTQYTQDVALTVATSVGTMAMGRSSAAVPTDVTADNDAVMPWYLRSGAQATQPTYGGVLAIAGNGIAGTGVQRVTIASDSTGVIGGTKTNNNAAPGATNFGVLSVLANAAAPTWTEGNLVTLSTDLSGALRVTTGTGGLSVVDNVAFTDNTSSLTPGGGVAEFASPTACTEGRYCAAATTLNRAIKVTLYDTSGVALTPSADVTHNATVSATGPQIMAVGSSTAPTAVTTGNAVRAWAGLNGQLVTQFIDPCSSLAKVTAPFSLTARAVVIAAAASKKNYICAIAVVAGVAEIFNLDEGTGTTCQTGTAAVVGSTTAANGLSFAANGGLAAIGSNATVIAGITANVDTCIVPSGSNRLSGFLTYVQQ